MIFPNNWVIQEYMLPGTESKQESLKDMKSITNENVI